MLAFELVSITSDPGGLLLSLSDQDSKDEKRRLVLEKNWFRMMMQALTRDHARLISTKRIFFLPPVDLLYHGRDVDLICYYRV